ncbi:hypothetical protein [Aurantiacibacter spongiae]|uniref:Uncharacterized protein n=1 Tax=Aurantiacibacter spongiae TaxID=2488860 RepID=A0A3N5DNK8_9SPHN|nr:hypothetical protein [Aurantiacibacter spongiae]RPF70641.1 hypothetical protein EG799_02620 [Aurantiacibacter spongiae]
MARLLVHPDTDLVAMKRLCLLAAFVALALPATLANWPARAEPTGDGPPAGPQSHAPLGFDPATTPPFDVLEQARRPLGQNQVRIEQRIIIRISPAPANRRLPSGSQSAERRNPVRFSEVDHGDCVPVRDIVGSQPTGDNRLLLYTRDRGILAASLERSCSARAFYSGFYIERSDDGQLCVARDRLLSRAGASCRVANFNRLVATGG